MVAQAAPVRDVGYLAKRLTNDGLPSSLSWRLLSQGEIPKGRANGKPRIVSEYGVNRRVHRRNESYILREGGEGEM